MRTLLLAAVLPGIAFAADVEVVHQGRVLDTDGTAIEGTHTLGLTLFNDATLSDPTNELHAEQFFNVSLGDGYYSLRMGADSGNRLDSGLFATGAVYLAVTVDGLAMGPRELIHHVPLAAYATTAGSAPVVSTGTIGTPCSPLGALAFDSTLDILKVCSSTGWSATGGIKTIVVDGTSRTFSDGTHATTCDGYLNPASPYTYAGVTGDGTYTIDPDGFGNGVDPFAVHCDMAGGGWTVLEHNLVGLTIPNKSVETPAEVYQVLTYPQSNAQIIALQAIVSQTSQYFRKDCRDSLINSDYGGSYTRFKVPDGSFVNSTQALWGGGSRRDCDLNDSVNRSAQITFSDTANIPIMELWGGDSGAASEVSTFEIGAFRAR